MAKRTFTREQAERTIGVEPGGVPGRQTVISSPAGTRTVPDTGEVTVNEGEVLSSVPKYTVA